MTPWDPEKVTFFAKTDARGQQVPFGIRAKDRQRHMYVIGKTGMGKSTLLENMAAQDIMSGEGMAFIDPHGSAIETLLEYIPEHRLDDVVYFAPFDMENPVAFNIMEDVGVDTRHLVVSGLMSTFKKIWEDAWSARMEYILTNALLALIEYPDTTLLSVNRMLADKVYRDKVVAHVKDPAVKAYWVDEFASYTERFAAEALPAIQNKIGQFTGNPLIRNIIGQPHSSFDVRKMMDEKKILLINLSKGLVGETNADLIGSMLITKIYLAAMSRAELPPAQMKQMPNFYFYVDEFQSFANSTFANILSEARKYHLNLIIAHQYVAQMEEKIRDAVFGNVGTTIAFRTGPFDAEVLETVFAPQFEAVDLVNLGMYQICLTLMIDGVGSTPFSATTLPPVATPSKSHKHMAIKRSQQNYSRPRAEVEQAVIDSHSPENRIAKAEEDGGGNKGGFAKPSAFHKVGSEPKGGGKKKPSNDNTNNNGKNTGPRSAAFQNRSATPDQAAQKPGRTEKTPEDLRAILASMTSSSSKVEAVPASATKEVVSAQAEPVSKPIAPATEKTQTVQPVVSSTQSSEPQKTTPAPQPTQTPVVVPKAADRTSDWQHPPREPRQLSSGSVRVQRPEQRSGRGQDSSLQPSNRQSPSQPQRGPRPVEKTPEDLRAILAKMTGALEKKAGVPTAPQEPRPAPASLTNKSKEPTLEVKESLKAALAGVLSRVEADAPPAPDAAPAASPQVPTSRLSKLEGSSQSIENTSESPVGASRRPAFEPHAVQSAPDIAIVKSILKTSGKERPPGM